MEISREPSSFPFLGPTSLIFSPLIQFFRVNSLYYTFNTMSNTTMMLSIAILALAINTAWAQVSCQTTCRPAANNFIIFLLISL